MLSHSAGDVSGVNYYLRKIVRYIRWRKRRISGSKEIIERTRRTSAPHRRMAVREAGDGNGGSVLCSGDPDVDGVRRFR